MGSDITYIRLSSGFAYLCAVIDLYTRSILAWRLSFTMDENLTLSVLSISSPARFEKHAFSAGEDALLMYGKPEIFNSDQGSQYTAQGFINTPVKHNVSISMDSKVRAIDNIFIIYFSAVIKADGFYAEKYDSGAR